MTKYRTKISGVRLVSRIGRALASPIRVRALAAVRGRQLCLCELARLFGQAPSTVSKHMSLLVAVGLVEARREGRWTYYSLPADPDSSVQRVFDFVDEAAEGDPEVLVDCKKAALGLCR